MKTHIVFGYMSNTFVNKTTFNENPVNTLNDIVFAEMLTYGDQVQKEVMLNYNEVDIKDSYFHMWDTYQTDSYNFLSLDGIKDMGIKLVNPTAYFVCQFKLSNRVIEYERVIYSFFDLMGDVGGFGEFVYVMLFLLMYGYANRMFIADVIRDMFFVRLETGNV